MSTDKAAEWMRWGRKHGATKLWLGGGEPLLRKDVLRLCKAARMLGYDEVHVQTNGVRLAYAAFADALSSSGVTHLRLNVKTHDAAVHDRLTQVDGSHASLDDALARFAGGAQHVTGDVLLTASTVPALAATIERYASRGVQAFSLWLLSASDSASPDVAREVPRLTDVAVALQALPALAARLGVTVESLHTPPCALPPELRSLFKPAASWGLVVVDASGVPFALGASPFEGGAYVATCASCSARSWCPGPRADYVAIHGASELTPLT